MHVEFFFFQPQPDKRCAPVFPDRCRRIRVDQTDTNRRSTDQPAAAAEKPVNAQLLILRASKKVFQRDDGRSSWISEAEKISTSLLIVSGS